ncbi:uncharacterized protein JCM10292_001247 [Rhodotorula paludigena]|uniref:uncharacterized protein n=1 Tax=Rhodotorula paludigena TaxID=86838 RepID=UPI00316E68E3
MASPPLPVPSSSSSSSSYLAQDDATLPLASFVHARAPAHPLPRLLTDALVPRIAAAEAALLASAPARLLRRAGIASERSIVALAVVAVAGALARYTHQWRAILWALGVGEAVARTLRLLERRDQPQAHPDSDKGKGRASEDAHDDVRDEAQHLLSFWLLFAALSLLDSLRTSPSTASSRPSLFALPTRVRDQLQSLRHTYLHFIRRYILPFFLRTRWALRSVVQRYPSLDLAPHLAKLPPFPYRLPSLSYPSSSTRRPTSFPQPRTRPWDPLPAALPLSWSYFAHPSSFSPSPASPAYSARATAAAEARWEVARLVLLWLGLRRDAAGAKSILWDWLLRPLVRALPHSRVAGVRGAGGGRREEAEWRIVRVQRGADKQGEEEDSAPAPRTSHDRPRTQPDTHDELHSPTLSPAPSPLPYALSSSVLPLPPAAQVKNPYAWTPRRTWHSSGPVSPSPSPSPAQTPRRRRSFSPAAHQRAFALQDPPSRATPAGVTYRYASKHHPLLAARSATSTSTSTSATDGRRRESLLDESPPSSPAMRARSADGQEEEEEKDGEGSVPPTPGEEEAEEGVRRWATVLAQVAGDELEPSGVQQVEGEEQPLGVAAVGRGWSV